MMKKLVNGFSTKLFIVPLLILALILSACGKTEKTQSDAKATSGTSKDGKTSLSMAFPSYNASYLPAFVAEKHKLFEKHNLNVSFTKVQGGVIALRGLQTNEFQIISSLPESVINGIASGANIKMIGTFDDQSMYSIYATSDIKKPEDLKGQVVATNRTGNGTDIQLRWWLQNNGLEPDKDVRIVEAGENSTRLQALVTGQAKLTILSQPTDLKAEAAGMHQLSLMRDDLKTYNHNMLIANGEFLKNNPEAAKGFMAAIAEATEYAKKPENKDEMIQIIMEKLEMNQEDAQKSFEFVLPALADKGKINIEGLKWAIDTTKEAGMLTGDVTVKQLYDDSFIAD
ncbi:ABC transporter substrate-binding protein [Niallia endozanthoxylica]|uniref:ABC transporter substrate-binding protein n=1 Tax=Niallia endozanthoxylica TaxID=2036016 RepID=A0A5J5GSG3_9BACI|nr:ABC transporter substrate-binding protein [Niallia endozanthoxylica]KAA9011286.1 ABC transporter substrate-binding protein [Niallia endozanthoxylica]